jgi:hypothetical protein
MKIYCLSLLVLLIAMSFGFSQNQPIADQQSSITNTRIVEMSKLGLDDDIIIAKIKNGTCEFQLEDTDLINLKKAGVSPKIIAAMLDANALTSPRVVVDNTLVPIHTMGQSKIGGRLGHDVSLGFKSVKEKAYLDGPHSSIVSSPSPMIEIDLPKADTIDNFILVQMDEKNNRRELEVEARGGLVGAKNGIRAEAIRKTHAIALGGNRFQMGTDPLKKGEYIIYVVGSPDSIRGIYGRGYDFSVRNVEMKRESTRVVTQKVSTPEPILSHTLSNVASDKSLDIQSWDKADVSRMGVLFSGNPTEKHDGLQISSVQSDGPAFNVGMESGDVIISIDGHYLYTVDDLRAELNRHEEGARLLIRYRRNRLTYENYLTLITREAAARK